MEISGGRQLAPPRGTRRRAARVASGQPWTVRPDTPPAEVDAAHALLHERLRDVLGAYERLTLGAVEAFGAGADASLAVEADLHELEAASARVRRLVRRLCAARGNTAARADRRVAAVAG